MEGEGERERGGTKLISTKQRSVNEMRRQTHVELVQPRDRGSDGKAESS